MAFTSSFISSPITLYSSQTGLAGVPLQGSEEAFTTELNYVDFAATTYEDNIMTTVYDMTDLLLIHDEIIEIASMIKLALCAFGLIGNLLVFLGLFREPRKTSTTFLLKCLAFSDSCNLIAWINLSLNMYFVKSIKQFTHATVNLFTSFLSVWTVVSLAINRYIIVCHPFQAKQMCRPQVAKRNFVIMVVCGIVWIGIYICIDTLFNPHYWVTKTYKDEVGTDVRYASVLVWTMFFLVILPMIIMCFTTFRIIACLKNRNELRVRLGRQLRLKQCNEKELNRSLITIFIIFVICQAMVLFRVIEFTFNHVFTFNPYIYILMRVGVALADIFLVVNSSVNFVVYIICSKHYRNAMLIQLCGAFYNQLIHSTGKH